LEPIEKLTIETPEQIELEFPVAGLGSRGMALLIDTLIQIVVVIVVIFLTEMISPDLNRYWVTAGKWMTAAVIFSCFACIGDTSRFSKYFERANAGEAPGADSGYYCRGRPVNTFETIARNFLRVLTQLAYMVGAIAIVVDKRNRRLGDMVAGTVVVHELQGAWRLLLVWPEEHGRGYAPRGSHQRDDRPGIPTDRNFSEPPSRFALRTAPEDCHHDRRPDGNSLERGPRRSSFARRFSGGVVPALSRRGPISLR
jgi:uncharacterized RDD family membrane protein YckC